VAASETENWILGDVAAKGVRPSCRCSFRGWNWITRVFHTHFLRHFQPRNCVRPMGNKSHPKAVSPIKDLNWCPETMSCPVGSTDKADGYSKTQHYVYAPSPWLGRSPKKPSHKFQLQSQAEIYEAQHKTKWPLWKLGAMCFTLDQIITQTSPPIRMGAKTRHTYEQLGLAISTGNWAAINAMQIHPSQPRNFPAFGWLIKRRCFLLLLWCIILFFFFWYFIERASFM